VVARLAAQGIVASARGSGLRVSFHAYNANEDVDAVLAALDACRPLLSA
jgi:selenocysteine lyase/cysteine desulfurase